jgi:hypothetical protein
LPWAEFIYLSGTPNAVYHLTRNGATVYTCMSHTNPPFEEKDEANNKKKKSKLRECNKLIYIILATNTLTGNFYPYPPCIYVNSTDVISSSFTASAASAGYAFLGIFPILLVLGVIFFSLLRFHFYAFAFTLSLLCFRFYAFAFMLSLLRFCYRFTSVRFLVPCILLQLLQEEFSLTGSPLLIMHACELKHTVIYTQKIKSCFSHFNTN